MSRQHYERRELGPAVRFYTSPGLGHGAWLGDEEYARARAALPYWCLDGLPCGHTETGEPVVVLVVRGDHGPGDGPFRNEPWVVGGKWDFVTPWEDFVRAKTVAELFDGKYSGSLHVEGPLGNQLFGTGWGPNTDGPFGQQGATLQLCYRVRLSNPVMAATLRPDHDHAAILIVKRGQSLAELHPYIRDVIELSGWLGEPPGGSSTRR